MKAVSDPLRGPHDIQIEQEVLGCILLYNQAHQLIADILRVEHFFEPLHQELYDICSELIMAGKSATPSTVKSFLPNDFEIQDGMKVSQYLARLAASATTIISVRDFATIIRDLADYRSILNIVEMAATVKGIDSDPQKAATAAIDRLDAIVAERSIGQVPSLSLGASVARAVDAAAKAYQADGALIGMATGFKELDAKTGGLHRSELTILAGRPGQGKSMLALNFSRTLCQAGRKGVFFSLEMGDESLSRRLISDIIFDQVELPHFRIRSGQFAEKEFQLITDAATALKDLPLRIEQQAGLTLSQICARSRQMKRRQGLDFIVVDHMGHVVASDLYRGNKVNEIGETSSGLLRLAKELDVAVIALSQLSRGVESRENKRPTLSDLRDSGNLEQDAATVLMVYREAYYLSNAEPKAKTPEYEVWQTKMTACLNDIEVIVSKQRDGSVGTVRAFVDVRCNAVRDHGWTREAWSLLDSERFVF